ncbi:MAG: cytochrome C [Proteobacteria bacterium]|nr:cytochrome C [Pseudomonadota bacterium]
MSRRIRLATTAIAASFRVASSMLLGLSISAAATAGSAWAQTAAAGVDPHAALLAETSYPSASQCAVCHRQIYNEWSSSNHAYASISPMFHKFEQAINELASGTVGTFCVRCHQGAGTQRGEPREKPLWERSAAAREGVTCISCHRVQEEYGRANGERLIEPGDVSAPVFNAHESTGLGKVIAENDFYKVATTPAERGSRIHLRALKNEQIGKSEFCLSCHQVAVHPGIKLEVVWEQYRAAPAAQQGVVCQECHMGKVPGKPMGYAVGPTAVVNGQAVEPNRKHSNHSFYGPGYPIAHPGIFPHNPKAENHSIQEWLRYDYRAGWGNPEFEDKVEKNQIKAEFPQEWADRVDREEAFEVIQENLQRLEEKRKLRVAVMENGSKIDGPFFGSTPRLGQSLSFTYRVANTSTGHNFPSGSLGAQPEIWLNVALTDPAGKTVWESGYTDSNGDMADLHSHDVAASRIKHDDQLFNLQTKFLTTNVKGTDREMYLPINFDVDQLPFIRPATIPTTVLNHPPFIRMEGRSLPPLSSRNANYSVTGSALSAPGKYRLSVRLRSRAEPIYFMRFVGATVEMEQAMNEWLIDIHPYAVEFEVK